MNSKYEIQDANEATEKTESTVDSIATLDISGQFFDELVDDTENCLSLDNQVCLPNLVSKRDFLFRAVDQNYRSRILIDDVSFYSVTESDSAEKISSLIAQELGGYCGQFIVLDGMACVGGNSLSFAKRFGHVFANELNEGRYNMLIHNLKNVMGFRNITYKKKCVLEVASSLPKYDVLFLDPEWGGPGYINEEKLRLNISDEPLEEFCMRILNTRSGVKLIALKLPINFDHEYFEDFVALQGYEYILNKDLRKMTLAIIRRRLDGP